MFEQVFGLFSFEVVAKLQVYNRKTDQIGERKEKRIGSHVTVIIVT